MDTPSQVKFCVPVKEGIDCDDKEPAINPGYPEICDGLDNDCDGIIDNRGSCRVPGEVGECSSGTYVCQGGDFVCVGPSSTEEICDGLDNDCDGLSDESLQGDENLAESCYGGSPEKAGVGICQFGIRTCTDGRWSGCEGQVWPAEEMCDGLDNDCDGFTDESLQSDESLFESCYDGNSENADVGSCRSGIRTCTDEIWSDCEGQIWPTEEICDGLDNNCNGFTDENLFDPCYGGDPESVDVGTCHSGIRTCTEGRWSGCEDQMLPVEEICDGLDNDCDGLTDENVLNEGNLSESCYDGASESFGVGVCQSGTKICTEGIWSDCEGQTLPTEEICDGLDNDCNDEVDNVLPFCSMRDHDGECTVGETVCDNNVLSCIPANGCEDDTGCIGPCIDDVCLEYMYCTADVDCPVGVCVYNQCQFLCRTDSYETFNLYESDWYEERAEISYCDHDCFDSPCIDFDDSRIGVTLGNPLPYGHYYFDSPSYYFIFDEYGYAVAYCCNDRSPGLVN